MSVDFPALGNPTRPTSASSFSSSRSRRSSPGRPGSCSVGAWCVEVEKRALPRPPRPPCATRNRSPGALKSCSFSPVSPPYPTLVPGGFVALAMGSGLGLVLGVETERKKRVLVLAGDEINIAAAAAIAAARTSARDILFAAKSQTAIAAVAGLYVDPDFVNEHLV